MRYLWRLGALIAGLAVPAAAFGSPVYFSTAGGNIVCVGDTVRPAGVRCDIATKRWTAPARPAGCRARWAIGARIPTIGRGRLVCAASRLSSLGFSVQPGQTVRAGSITCVAARTSITCRNRSGRGFLLGTIRYRLI